MMNLSLRVLSGHRLIQMNPIVKAGFIIFIEEAFHERQVPKMHLSFPKCSDTSGSECLHFSMEVSLYVECIQALKQITWTQSQQFKTVK